MTIAIHAERAASLTAHGLSDAEIMKALRIDEAKLLELRGLDAYGDAYAEKVVEKAEHDDVLNKGWDAVEDKSLEVVLGHLQYSKDPQFALAAARTANMATRKKPSGREQLNGRAHENTVVVNINMEFARRIEKGMTINGNNEDVPQRRIIDAPNPKMIERLLAPEMEILDEENDKSSKNELQELMVLERELQRA